MKTKTETKKDTKSVILSKSEDRFSYYEFNKTTMAEIAKDCDMSAANLYRYFENKEEIGVAVVEQCMNEKEKIFRNVVQMTELSAGETLEKFVIEELNYLCCQISEKTKISELVQFISTHRMDIVDAHCGKKKALIAEVMAKGNASGEFEIADIVAAAELADRQPAFEAGARRKAEDLVELEFGDQLIHRGLAVFSRYLRENQLGGIAVVKAAKFRLHR